MTNTQPGRQPVAGRPDLAQPPRTAADRAIARILVLAAGERDLAARDRARRDTDDALGDAYRAALDASARRHESRAGAYFAAVDIIRQELTAEADRKGA